MSQHQTMTQSALLDEMKARFGPDPMNWAFQCPNCGDIAKVGEFVGLKVGSDRAGRECIGRHLGALDKTLPRGKYRGRGCDWAAYGLFRGPVEYTTNAGKSVWGFAIAPTTQGV